MAFDGLRDRAAVRASEGNDASCIGRDDGGWHEVAESVGIQLLVRVAQAPRRIDHERVASKVVEQQRHVEVRNVKRRVRANQYRVDCGEVDVLDVAGLSETPSFVLRPYSDPDPELRTFLRLLNCQGQDAFLLEALFRQQCWQLISDPLSKENEADCCASILDGVAAALSAYASRGVDQEKSTLTSTPGSLTHRQNLAVRVRLAEKSALIETASFFDVVASRLDKLEYYQERRLRSLNLLDEDGSSTYDPFNETMA